MWLNDFLSSCLATKGQTIQLTTTAETTPVVRAKPLVHAICVEDSDPLLLWELKETTVKLRHAINPERGWDESMKRKTVKTQLKNQAPLEQGAETHQLEA